MLAAWVGLVVPPLVSAAPCEHGEGAASEAHHDAHGPLMAFAASGPAIQTAEAAACQHCADIACAPCMDLTAFAPGGQVESIDGGHGAPANPRDGSHHPAGIKPPTPPPQAAR